MVSKQVRRMRLLGHERLATQMALPGSTSLSEGFASSPMGHHIGVCRLTNCHDVLFELARILAHTFNPLLYAVGFSHMQPGRKDSKPLKIFKTRIGPRTIYFGSFDAHANQVLVCAASNKQA